MIVVVVAAGCGDDNNDPSSESPTGLPNPDDPDPTTSDTVNDGNVVVQIRTRGEPADPGGPEDEPRPNARIGLIAETDVDAWWPAVTDDVERAIAERPHGRQLVSTVERLDAAPARWLDTDANGEAVVEVEPGNYLLCAVTPLDSAVLAGCRDVELNESGAIKVLYSDAMIVVRPA